MPPKKSESAASKSKASSHGTYQDMITDAIVELKDRNGSSRQKLKQYVKNNNSISVSQNMFDSLFNKALKAGVEKGVFQQPKGPSGGTKLAKKTSAKPAATKEKKPAAATAKKPAAKKESAKPAAKPAAKKETKPAAPKKAAAATTKKAAPKKAAAPTEKKPAAKKTATGRVTKKPAAPKKAAAKPAAAKAATKKKAA